VLFHAPHAFDASTYEIWAPLLSGGCIVVAPSGAVDATLLRTLVPDRGVTRVHLTAGLFAVLADDLADCLATVREVMTGGDVVSPLAVTRLLDAGVAVSTQYGPTEMTLCATRATWVPGWPAGISAVRA